ncbi:MAG TPA: uroporphyrinogen decarboxylase family protein [Nitrospirota bacterium]|nr:uroporphyrinogen decarboxylase family protein [Nitrospirota bacterium]
METPREVIDRALNRETADRIPAALIGAGTWSAREYGVSFKQMSTDSSLMARMITEMADRLKSDIVYVGSGYPNFPVAALGCAINYRDVGTPDLEGTLVHAESDLTGLDLSRISSDPVLSTIRQAYGVVSKALGNYAVTLTAWGPFTLGARLVGEEAMMKALYKNPGLVKSVTEFAVSMLKLFYEPLLSPGLLDLILLGEPTASGDLISRKQFEQFVLPQLQDFISWAAGKGARTILHICGNTTDRLDLYPRTGVHCISLDHKTDMVRAKEILHGTICFAGNVDPVNVLLRGTVQDVEDACRNVIEKVGTRGGFILMPGCDIPPGVPYENIHAFMRVAREWAV